jgi:cytochrome c oxidase assembly protein subunit 15
MSLKTINSSEKSFRDLAIARWLELCLLGVLLMVCIGGLTRLTESGLSITEWRPISGVFPPHDAQSWNEAFLLYQASPEYQQRTLGMSLQEFKRIYWMEFLHRLFGRSVGFLFIVPLMWFTAARKINLRTSIGLLGIFALGGAQGLVGWFMVRSGLQLSPMVSPYWLTAHLLTAMIIFALINLQALRFRYGLLLHSPRKSEQLRPFRRLVSIGIVLLFLQVGFGGMMAGWDAGLLFNSFPLMEGKLIPDGIFILDPWYKNFGENTTMIHFIHRAFAVILVGFWFCVLWSIWKKSEKKNLRFLALYMAIALVFQFALGGLVVISYVQISLASLHQLLAFLLLWLGLRLWFALRVDMVRPLFMSKTAE